MKTQNDLSCFAHAFNSALNAWMLSSVVTNPLVLGADGRADPTKSGVTALLNSTMFPLEKLRLALATGQHLRAKRRDVSPRAKGQ